MNPVPDCLLLFTARIQRGEGRPVLCDPLLVALNDSIRVIRVEHSRRRHECANS